MASPCLLIGDLGGTNARFALADTRGPAFTDELTLTCKEFATAEDAIAAYLEHVGGRRPRVICLAVAGPIVGQTVRFLNNNWTLDVGTLAARFPSARIRLVNDFEAVASSVPLLEAADLEPVGLLANGLPDRKEFTVGVVGPGTGLGVAGLLGRGGRYFPVSGEGGHTGFAPETKVQMAVLKQLRERFERVSDERLLSGPGLENILWALQKIQGAPTSGTPAADIFRQAQEGQALAGEAVQLFFQVLGQVAGNLALTLGATDGVFIAGGIVRRYPEMFKASGFRAGFENKGRHRALMERIPSYLITHPQPGLLGAGHVARDLQARSSRRKAVP